MNTYDANDPKLTAFALGELPADEAAAFETTLKENSALRGAVDEIRHTAELLKAGFAADPVVGLTSAHRAAIEREMLLTSQIDSPMHEIRASPSRLRFATRAWWTGAGLLAAACLVLAFFAPALLQDRKANNQVAIAKKEKLQSEAGQAMSEQFDLRSGLVRIDGEHDKSGDRRELGNLETKDAKDRKPNDERLAAAGQIRFDNAPTLDLDAALKKGQAAGSSVPLQNTHVAANDPSQAGALYSAMIGGGAIAGDGGTPAAAVETAAPVPADDAWYRQNLQATAIDEAARKISAPLQDRAGRVAAPPGGVPPISSPTAPAITPPPGPPGRPPQDWYQYSAKVDGPLTIESGRVAMGPNPNRIDNAATSRGQGPNTENYQPITDNPFIKPTGEEALSTFSIDVDTASYANVRRMLLDERRLPPKDAVRIEEMINYFDYRYEPPSGEAPFSAAVEVNAAPWNTAHRLVRIGLKGKEIKADMRPATNLVFLIDVSGSMQPAIKLPLVKQSLKLLVDKLNSDDRLAIVTYAGNAQVLQDSIYITGENKPAIINAIDQLQAGGSTNGGGGIVAAYDIAVKHFIKGGVNRVVLCTDGDFNVGVSSDAELVRLIEEKRSTGVFLSVLGFGTGNYQDAKMQQLADAGNGNHAYIDSLDEARKVLVDQMCGTLITIAKDVKIQVEFNPAKVGMYRLIGYENRMLAAADFNNDKKDAGEIGAGHTVTALYEVIPLGEAMMNAGLPVVDELEFQKPAAAPETKLVPSDDLLILKLRYKEPDGDQSKLIRFPVEDSGMLIEKASFDFQFAAAVASFGMILRDSPYKGNATYGTVLDLAGASAGDVDGDAKGYRSEFVQIVQRAKEIASQP